MGTPSGRGRAAAVTIGLPFSHEPIGLIERAVRSVFSQTRTDWRLCIVGDAPDPITTARLAQISDERVKMVVHDTRAGLATRLNEISLSAETELLARMDADDVMHPERLANQIPHFSEPIHVLGSRVVAIDEQAELLGILKEPELPTSKQGFLRSHALTHPSVMGRTAWFRDNPYRVDLRRSEDKELWLRTGSSSNLLKTSDIVLFYNLLPLTRTKQAQDASYDRMILREYGPSLVGSTRTHLLLVKSRVKQGVFSQLVRAGQRDRLRANKVSRLGAMQARDLELALHQATSAPVPGWE